MMNDHLFNKIQYDFFANHLRKDLGQVKSTKSCQWLVATHRLGRIVDGVWFYTEQDRIDILNLVYKHHQVNLLNDPYPVKKSRTDNAKTHHNEKLNSLSVTNDFVLVNSLQSLKLNKKTININELNTLGIYLNANLINSVEHTSIVFVENLAVMANLQHLVLTDNALHLKEALWVYRGDIKAQQNTSQAYIFFRRFSGTHQLICFSDFDPEGIIIAARSGATGYLAPGANVLQHFSLNGVEKDYYKQIEAVKKLNKIKGLSAPCRELVDAISAHKRTIKQEHILAHQIPLSVFELS
ncbi:hypothetical protein E2R68_05270 [Psychromonas sp. RZ22]|uniref:DUF7281 domain-containing protein n=1 Tax=Psychromonas algarum TaxID=2555643 RepID=UPI001067DC73|nr:hypothetical protein [Psychromonas sp. RZ22]TEW55170.1 hypothetical protein E2R68_05270 [Psychromonas sp. RZ22]